MMQTPHRPHEMQTPQRISVAAQPSQLQNTKHTSKLKSYFAERFRAAPVPSTLQHLLPALDAARSQRSTCLCRPLLYAPHTRRSLPPR